jgi:hypothetical protein
MSYVFFHPSAMQPGFFVAISFGRRWELRAASNSDGNLSHLSGLFSMSFSHPYIFSNSELLTLNINL